MGDCVRVDDLSFNFFVDYCFKHSPRLVRNLRSIRFGRRVYPDGLSESNAFFITDRMAVKLLHVWLP
jgi:hypothetical protein